jgi:hypothetical protein
MADRMQNRGALIRTLEPPRVVHQIRGASKGSRESRSTQVEWRTERLTPAYVSALRAATLTTGANEHRAIAERTVEAYDAVK